ncbi:MAG: hypothetical protein P8L68_11325 [Paracoccaceae bacterium]|nr:hypothetical protein [Paracoccaceae bacterium]MDG2259073.1 hypothetical protein [Paracoccaceae bacterium]
MPKPLGIAAIGIMLVLSVLLSACRDVQPGLKGQVAQEWANESTADICHYLYWPIPDPTASKDLKLLHYSIMQEELDRRAVDCQEHFPDNKMFERKSMLEKTAD